MRAGGEGGGHLTCEWPRAAEGEGNEEGDWGACLKREPDIWMQGRAPLGWEMGMGREDAAPGVTP